MRTALMVCIHERGSSVQVEKEIITMAFSFKCRKLLVELLERLNASYSALVRASVESDTLDLTKEPEMVP